MQKTSYVMYHISMASCQKGLTRHAYAWQIGPFWQDTLDIRYIDGLAQDCGNCSANTLELQQSCTKQSVWYLLRNFGHPMTRMGRTWTNTQLWRYPPTQLVLMKSECPGLSSLIPHAGWGALRTQPLLAMLLLSWAASLELLTGGIYYLQTT